MTMFASMLLTMWMAGRAYTYQSPIQLAARDLLVNFTAGDFETASKNFNDDMRRTVTPALLAEMKKAADARVGAFMAIKSVQEKRSDGFRTVEMLVQYTKGQALVRVQFDAIDRVGAIFFDPILPPPTDPTRERIAREFLASINARHFDEATKSFDSKLRTQLPAAGVAKLANDLTGAYGAFHEIVDLHEVFENGFNRIDVTSDYDRQRVRMSVVFGPTNQVNGIRITPVIQ